MSYIVGREEEKTLLKKYYQSNQSELVVIYGRMRVGKTYLIDNYFEDNFFLKATGMLDVSTKEQIKSFLNSMNSTKECKDWFGIFEILTNLIKSSGSNKKKVIFLDEISWFARKNSYFLPAFEHFWNHFCVTREDILILICGSATSWIINNLFGSVGGMYNRITGKMEISPFTLHETEEYLKYRETSYPKMDILDLYMILGGVPYYYNFLDKNLSVPQNIDKLFFERTASLRNEFDFIFKSLFESSDKYKIVIETISSKSEGVSRDEISQISKIPTSGRLTAILTNLERSSIIRSYTVFPNKSKGKIYQLIDHFMLFCTSYISNQKIEESNYWSRNVNSSLTNSWKEYSFEMVCFNHLDEIKAKLGILGVYCELFTWRTSKVQIDLLIYRNDRIIDLLEIKYTSGLYSLTLDEYNSISKKKMEFYRVLSKNVTIHTVLITTLGSSKNSYLNSINYELTLEDLFKCVEHF
jgi:AAA+ ATPase superfamily predicted ATPase